MKYFIITVDTEGDDLWSWHGNEPISTRNVEFLPRFQELCNKYSFKPTWLANWEIINAPGFVDFAKTGLKNNNCEVGMHLHAWNTPPKYKLSAHVNSGLPYLIEYPFEIMEKKIVTMTDSFIRVFGQEPKTHRAGRWAMNNDYFRLLYKHGIRVDCSVTPYINWETSIGQTLGAKGTDYSKEKNEISYRNGILEVPVSTMLSRKRFTKEAVEKQKTVPDFFAPRVFWLRPTGNNLKSMKYLINSRAISKCDYLEFMIHSSELMPAGSPNFKSEEDIERLYEHMNVVFELISKKYRGVGLEEYWRIKAGEETWEMRK